MPRSPPPPDACVSAARRGLLRGVCAATHPQIGWSKVQELHRLVKAFRESGKFTMAYMKVRQGVGWGGGVGGVL
jgi:hypothetical protein